MGRQVDDDRARAAKLRKLRDLVDDHADDHWLNVDGGPTLEAMAGLTGYHPNTLDKAYRRYGTTWGAEKELARRRVFGRKVPILSVVNGAA